MGEDTYREFLKHLKLLDCPMQNITNLKDLVEFLKLNKIYNVPSTD